MSVADYFPVVQQLYIAYFGRPADPGGLDAFARQLDAMGAPADVTQLSNAYRVPGNAGLRALVDGFGNSGESARLYGNGDSAMFVRAVFANVLDRQPLSSGLGYWVGELDSGRVSRGEAAMRIMAGAFSNTSNVQQAAVDQQTVLNRTGAAGYFTGLLDTPSERDAYRGASAASHARVMLENIKHYVQWEIYRPDLDAVAQRIAPGFPVRDTMMLSNGAAYTGTAQAERIAASGQPGPITLGDGDDTLLLIKPTLSSKGSIDGGAGHDTLAISASDARALGSLRAPGAVSNIERLQLFDMFGETIQVDGIGAFSHISLQRNPISSHSGARLDGVASGASIAVDPALGELTVNVKDALAGQADVLTISASASASEATYLRPVRADHVETVHLSLTMAALGQFETHYATILAPHATSITLSGEGPLALSLNSKLLTSLDASAYRGKVHLMLPEMSARTVIKGALGGTILSASQNSVGIDYAGNDGADLIHVGAGSHTIRTGFGNDSVQLQGGASVVDLGAGIDEAIVSFVGMHKISGGAGTDAFYLQDPNASSKYSMTTIADLGAWETVRFMGYGGFVTEAKVGAALSLGGSPSLDQYLDAAATGDTRGTFHWFVLGQETFMVCDLSSAATFVAGGDMVVKLVGVHDLSGGSFSADGTFHMAGG